jgi:hypothetical protein
MKNFFLPISVYDFSKNFRRKFPQLILTIYNALFCLQGCWQKKINLQTFLTTHCKICTKIKYTIHVTTFCKYALKELPRIKYVQGN